jgi:hypothetical protein
LKSARERIDIIAAYREAGTYREAAEIAGTTHKTVKRVIVRHEAGGAAPVRAQNGPLGMREMITAALRLPVQNGGYLRVRYPECRHALRAGLSRRAHGHQPQRCLWRRM